MESCPVLVLLGLLKADIAPPIGKEAMEEVGDVSDFSLRNTPAGFGSMARRVLVKISG